MKRQRIAAPVTPSLAETFARYQHILAARVAAVVDARHHVIERACWMACAQVLHHELADLDAGNSWLTTLAIREAVRLNRQPHRRMRRTATAGSGEGRSVGEALLARAAVVIQDAGLTPAQLQAVALELWGLGEERIAAMTGETPERVERSIARGREKLVEVLDGDYSRRA